MSYSTVSGGSWARQIPRGILEAGSDECFEERVTGTLHQSYSTVSGGLSEGQILTDLRSRVGPPKKPFARLRKFGESGSDERLEDPGSGRLKVSYSMRSGGSRRSCGGWK